MKQIDKDHLEGLTAENFLEHKEEVLSNFSCNFGRHGGLQMGVAGYGKFCVKVSKTLETFRYDTPQEAIDKYTEIYKTIHNIV